jgi:hypothetical protein
MKMPIEVLLEALTRFETLSYGNASQSLSGSFDRFELSATGMHPKAFPGSFASFELLSRGVPAMQDCRVVLSAGS